MDWKEKERIYIDKLNEQMREIEMLRSFIARARAESTLIERGQQALIMVPYWFMRDDSMHNMV